MNDQNPYILASADAADDLAAYAAQVLADADVFSQDDADAQKMAAHFATIKAALDAIAALQK